MVFIITALVLLALLAITDYTFAWLLITITAHAIWTLVAEGPPGWIILVVVWALTRSMVIDRHDPSQLSPGAWQDDSDPGG